jgi:hypothetical protein
MAYQRPDRPHPNPGAELFGSRLAVCPRSATAKVGAKTPAA